MSSKSRRLIFRERLERQRRKCKSKQRLSVLRVVDWVVLLLMQRLFQAKGEALVKVAFHNAKLGAEEMARAAGLLQKYAVVVEEVLKEFRVMTGKLSAAVPHGNSVGETVPVNNSNLLVDFRVPREIWKGT